MGILDSINLIIVLAAVFFFTSTLSSHINELYSGFSNARGRRLHNFLVDSLGQEVADGIYGHVLIKTIQNKGGIFSTIPQYPNYIENSIFGRVVESLFHDVGSKIANTPLFVTLSQEAEAEGGKLAQKAEEWFASAGESMSGRYTRTTTVALFAIGLLLAAAFDIDSLHIAFNLSADGARLESIASEIAESAPADPANPTEEERSAVMTAASKLFVADTSVAAPVYGWQTPANEIGSKDWMLKVFGWILTAIATSLGAQFWFKILSEALKIRQTQRKPDDETPAATGTETEEAPAQPPAASLPQETASENLVFASFAPQASDGNVLGRLSSKYEVGNRGPGTVSSGVGDKGGVSYGSYQMTSANGGGTVKRFVTDGSYAGLADLKALKPGEKKFTDKWKTIAAADPKGFFAAQHDYIKKTHYDVLVQNIKKAGGPDVTNRTDALQNVVWSTAVQHGGATDVVSKAIGRLGGTAPSDNLKYDEKLIRAIYAERGRKNPDGTLARFSGNSVQVQASVAQRFVSELKDALKMLDAERRVETLEV